MRWDWVKRQSLFTYFIKIDLPTILRCTKLSSISTNPHKQRTFEMGLGEMAVLFHICQRNRPSTRGAKLSSIPTISQNTVHLRWDWVKWRSFFTYFIEINLPRVSTFHRYQPSTRINLPPVSTFHP